MSEGKNETFWKTSRKIAAVIYVLIILGNIINILLTDGTTQAEIFSSLMTILLIGLIIAWFYFDGKEHSFIWSLKGIILGVAFFPVGLVFYFLKSRGKKKGIKSLLFLLAYICSVVVSILLMALLFYWIIK